MSKIIINTHREHDCTIGTLSVEGSGFRCFTLELPWLDNARNISAIPRGEYKYVLRDSPSLGRVIWLQNVKGRTWIYIHKGNFTHQIHGCILVGMGVKDINADGTPDLTDSAKAFDKLMSVIEPEGVVILR